MLRDDLLFACGDTARAILALPTPELAAVNGQLAVRELRGDDLVFVSDSKTGLEDRERWAVRSICDKAGNRVLGDADLPWINGEKGIPTPVLERAYYAARQVTGFTEENRQSFLPASSAAAGSGSPISSPSSAASGTSTAS